MNPYLILTKALADDVGRWGIPARELGLFVDNEGNILDIKSWEDLPNGTAVLLVINMLLPMPPCDQSSCREAIASLIGRDPRIWVHFGELNSDKASSENVAARWQKRQYDGFRKLSGAPMPYSAHISESWDSTLAELSQAVKNVISDQGHRRLANLEGRLVQLDSAWNAASIKCPPPVTIRAGKKHGEERLLQSLMPTFIYLDGLRYAYEIRDQGEREDKVRGMEELIRSDLKHALNVLTPDLKRSCPPQLQDLMTRLASESGDLKSIASEFCAGYKEFLRGAMIVT